MLSFSFNKYLLRTYRWRSGTESACQCRRFRFDHWVGKILWRRKWEPTPVFLPGKSHGQRSLTGYSPWGCRKLETTLWLRTHIYTSPHFWTSLPSFPSHPSRSSRNTKQSSLCCVQQIATSCFTRDIGVYVKPHLSIHLPLPTVSTHPFFTSASLFLLWD